jgi:UDP-N-acetylglucosamine 2-epimerase
MNNDLKVMTVVGTRPEIIRLAETIKLLDLTTNHVLVHTGQNYDYELNEVFFKDLGLRKPDYFLNARVESLGSTLGSILEGVEKIIKSEKPDAMLVLGDTNSCISAVIGKRMKVPVYHMEAGNRCFDQNVPEETNRKLVDHVSDYNLVYSEHARQNLLSEGIHPSQIMMTGSPLNELLEVHKKQISSSQILDDLKLSQNEYFLVSIHREENVDSYERLNKLLISLNNLIDRFDLPVVISTHPRTRKRLEDHPGSLKERLTFLSPFGFLDYVHLQKNAMMVLSDSGTISEESSILGFPAITLRDSIERPEAIDSGSILLTGVEPDQILNGVENTLVFWNKLGKVSTPTSYQILDTSRRVVSFILSTAKSHYSRNGIRQFTHDFS